jgi:hypothetical protein
MTDRREKVDAPPERGIGLVLGVFVWRPAGRARQPPGRIGRLRGRQVWEIREDEFQFPNPFPIPVGALAAVVEYGTRFPRAHGEVILA